MARTPCSAAGDGRAAELGVAALVEGLQASNTMPAFELLVKPLIDSPGKRRRSRRRDA
jgi:hypothetical protein